MSGSELWTAPALEGAGFSPAVSELWAQWAITWPVWARAHDETGSPLYGTELSN